MPLGFNVTLLLISAVHRRKKKQKKNFIAIPIGTAEGETKNSPDYVNFKRSIFHHPSVSLLSPSYNNERNEI